jgi:hypothetical protein
MDAEKRVADLLVTVDNLKRREEIAIAARKRFERMTVEDFAAWKADRDREIEQQARAMDAQDRRLGRPQPLD